MNPAEVVAFASGAVNLLVTILAVGRAHSQITARQEYTNERLTRLEHTIGNGEPGAFVRRAEWQLMNEKRDNQLETLKEQVAAIAEAVRERGH